MREALSVYAEYMQRKASETVPKEGESIAKKPRTENSDSNNTSVPSTSEIVVLEPAKEKDEGETASSSEDESQNAETPKTVELLRRKSTSTSECREKMRSQFVSLRSDADDKCKLKYSITPLYCAGVTPYKHSARPPESVFRRDANKEGQERYESIALESRHVSSTLRWRFQSESYRP